MPIEYMFCFIFCGEQCIKIISSCKKCGLLSSVFKKVIPNTTPPTFQEVGGVCKSFTDIKTMLRTFQMPLVYKPHFLRDEMMFLQINQSKSSTHI